MIYVETGSDSVYYNFALEKYFMTEKRLPDTIFLLWRTTPTLMIGKYQNVLEEINKPYVDEHGITIVRRMSGGGTIYTDLGGWQFTFIQDKNSKKIEFHEFTSPIIAALKDMGITAEFTGRNDLVIDGKKFSGNAQYILENCVVHHGSLLFDTNIEQMVESTTVDSYKILSKSIKSVKDRVTNIKDHMSPDTDMDSVGFKECMISHVMSDNDEIYELTPEDDARIREILKEDFDNWEKIYGSNPKFNIERVGRFAGGKMQFKIDVQKGIIKEASVYGDFFSGLDSKIICDAIIGCRYDKQSVYDSLIANKIDGAIYKISAEEIASLIAD